MTAIFHHLLNVWDGIISLQATDHFWNSWDAPYLRPFSTLGCFSVTVEGERIFGWDSHRDPAGKTWKLHGMVSLGKRNFPFAITDRRRKTFYCPASDFVRFQVQNDSETLAKERNPICQPILNDSQFSQIHIHFLFPSSPLSLASPQKKRSQPQKRDTECISSKQKLILSRPAYRCGRCARSWKSRPTEAEAQGLQGQWGETKAALRPGWSRKFPDSLQKMVAI